MQQKTRPLICFPQKLTLKQLPREPNPNHKLAVTTVFCVQGDSVCLRTRYQIKPPKRLNVCFYRALSFVVCACIVNVVFPLLNTIFLFQITYKNSAAANQRLLRGEAELWNICLDFFFPAFVCPRDNGTLQNRTSFWSRFRTPISDVPWRGFSRAPCSCPGCPAGRNLWPQPGGSSTPGAWELWPAACPESCKSLSLYLFPSYLPSSRLMVEWTLSINNCHFGMLRSGRPR